MAAGPWVHEAPKHNPHKHHTTRQPAPTATITVGADDWANQVINNVVGSEHQCSAETDQDFVATKIAEKLRLFHVDRSLELKNLPDGVSEQVKSPYLLLIYFF